MSNFLAIATVTATLSRILQGAVGADVPGATVTTVRPDSTQTGVPATGVNLFLFQVTPNGALGNSDLPARRSDGSLVQRPQVALDLHYLVTFYGNDGQLEPQRLLGSVVRTLRERPVLTRQMIRDTIANAAFPFLAQSTLADQVELVKFAPISLSLEELSKLWAVFFQTPYTLSVAYQGTVVLIESDEAAQGALPVQGRNVYVVPFRQPVIERVMAQAGADQPIIAEATLVIFGRQLLGDGTQVRVRGIDVPPQDVSDTQITVRLSSPPFPAGSLRAGVQGVQVAHQMLMGTPPELHRSVESNVAAFVFRPTIDSITVSNVQGSGTAPRSADLAVTVAPIVGGAQRVILLLDEVSTAAPAAYSFVADSHPTDTDTLTFHVSGVKAATHLVRVQVDGAESPLDLDPGSPSFGPTVTIP